jgi:hypothetical protein
VGLSQYTVVQHSGYGYGGDELFEAGLESRELHAASEIARVRKAGGMLFPSYLEAEDFAEKAMYPEGSGIVPAAKGTFAEAKIDGLRIYVPVRVAVG